VRAQQLLAQTEAQKYQGPRPKRPGLGFEVAPKPRPRIRDLLDNYGLEFETFSEDLGLEFETSRTRFTQDSNSRPFASETRELRDRKSELIDVCDAVLSIQFKCLAPINTGSNILSTRFQNSNVNNQILS
jgi:hypothetical protein